MTAPFSFEAAERRIGAAAMDAAHRNAAEAPPIGPVIREHVRAVFASARISRPRPTTKAA